MAGRDDDLLPEGWSREQSKSDPRKVCFQHLNGRRMFRKPTATDDTFPKARASTREAPDDSKARDARSMQGQTATVPPTILKHSDKLADSSVHLVTKDSNDATRKSTGELLSATRDDASKLPNDKFVASATPMNRIPLSESKILSPGGEGVSTVKFIKESPKRAKVSAESIRKLAQEADEEFNFSPSRPSQKPTAHALGAIKPAVALVQSKHPQREARQGHDSEVRTNSSSINVSHGHRAQSEPSIAQIAGDNDRSRRGDLVSGGIERPSSCDINRSATRGKLHRENEDRSRRPHGRSRERIRKQDTRPSRRSRSRSTEKRSFETERYSDRSRFHQGNVQRHRPQTVGDSKPIILQSILTVGKVPTNSPTPSPNPSPDPESLSNGLKEVESRSDHHSEPLTGAQLVEPRVNLVMATKRKSTELNDSDVKADQPSTREPVSVISDRASQDSTVFLAQDDPEKKLEKQVHLVVKRRSSPPLPVRPDFQPEQAPAYERSVSLVMQHGKSRVSPIPSSTGNFAGPQVDTVGKNETAAAVSMVADVQAPKPKLTSNDQEVRLISTSPQEISNDMHLATTGRADPYEDRTVSSRGESSSVGLNPDEPSTKPNSTSMVPNLSSKTVGNHGSEGFEKGQPHHQWESGRMQTTHFPQPPSQVGMSETSFNQRGVQNPFAVVPATKDEPTTAVFKRVANMPAYAGNFTFRLASTVPAVSTSTPRQVQEPNLADVRTVSKNTLDQSKSQLTVQQRHRSGNVVDATDRKSKVTNLPKGQRSTDAQLPEAEVIDLLSEGEDDPRASTPAISPSQATSVDSNSAKLTVLPMVSGESSGDTDNPTRPLRSQHPAVGSEASVETVSPLPLSNEATGQVINQAFVSPTLKNGDFRTVEQVPRNPFASDVIVASEMDESTSDDLPSTVKDNGSNSMVGADARAPHAVVPITIAQSGELIGTLSGVVSRVSLQVAMPELSTDPHPESRDQLQSALTTSSAMALAGERTSPTSTLPEPSPHDIPDKHNTNPLASGAPHIPEAEPETSMPISANQSSSSSAAHPSHKLMQISDINHLEYPPSASQTKTSEARMIRPASSSLPQSSDIPPSQALSALQDDASGAKVQASPAQRESSWTPDGVCYRLDDIPEKEQRLIGIRAKLKGILRRTSDIGRAHIAIVLAKNVRLREDGKFLVRRSVHKTVMMHELDDLAAYLGIVNDDEALAYNSKRIAKLPSLYFPVKPETDLVRSGSRYYPVGFRSRSLHLPFLREAWVCSVNSMRQFVVQQEKSGSIIGLAENARAALIQALKQTEFCVSVPRKLNDQAGALLDESAKLRVITNASGIYETVAGSLPQEADVARLWPGDVVVSVGLKDAESGEIYDEVFPEMIIPSVQADPAARWRVAFRPSPRALSFSPFQQVLSLLESTSLKNDMTSDFVVHDLFGMNFDVLRMVECATRKPCCHGRHGPHFAYRLHRIEFIAMDSTEMVDDARAADSEGLQRCRDIIEFMDPSQWTIPQSSRAKNLATGPSVISEDAAPQSESPSRLRLPFRDWLEVSRFANLRSPIRATFAQRVESLLPPIFSTTSPELFDESDNSGKHAFCTDIAAALPRYNVDIDQLDVELGKTYLLDLSSCLENASSTLNEMLVRLRLLHPGQRTEWYIARLYFYYHRVLRQDPVESTALAIHLSGLPSDLAKVEGLYARPQRKESKVELADDAIEIFVLAREKSQESDPDMAESPEMSLVGRVALVHIKKKHWILRRLISSEPSEDCLAVGTESTFQWICFSESTRKFERCSTVKMDVEVATAVD